MRENILRKPAQIAESWCKRTPGSKGTSLDAIENYILSDREQKERFILIFNVQIRSVITAYSKMNHVYQVIHIRLLLHRNNRKNANPCEVLAGLLTF